MASYSSVRSGLKTRLETISSPAWQVYARAPGNPVIPCAIVLPGQPAIVFDATMGRGSDDLRYRVLVLIGKPDDELAQENLDPYLAGSGAQSVKAAVEGAAIAGTSFAVVQEVSEYGDVTYAGKDYLGAEFAVIVNAPGSS
jgi:hypothetical protein